MNLKYKAVETWLMICLPPLIFLGPEDKTLCRIAREKSSQTGTVLKKLLKSKFKNNF